jgi:hypothetical protein
MGTITGVPFSMSTFVPGIVYGLVHTLIRFGSEGYILRVSVDGRSADNSCWHLLGRWQSLFEFMPSSD